MSPDFYSNKTYSFLVEWESKINPDGRVYWHNFKTKESYWDKPLELWTPFEVNCEMSCICIIVVVEKYFSSEIH